MATEILRPNGDTSIALDRNTGSTNWQQVDDASPDNDSTYVFNQNEGVLDQDIYEMDSTALTDQVINNITVTARARHSGGSGSTPMMVYGVRRSGSSSTGTVNFLNSSYTNHTTSSLSRPGGGSWVVGDLNSLQGVLQLNGRTGASVDCRCTQFFVTVDYAPEQTISPSGIASSVAFGTPGLAPRVSMEGIESEEAFGALSIIGGAAPATVLFAVDWDNDGFFGNALSDLTPYTLSIECERGRDKASQVVGRSVAGSLRATVLNTDGEFSSFNTSSPLYGKVLPNRKVRLLLGGVSVWAGYLSRVSPSSLSDGLNVVNIEASGPFVKLSGPTSKVNPPAQSNAQVGTIIDAILDEVDWPAANRAIDAGVVTVANWYAQDRSALQAIQELSDDTEFGFFREGRDWDAIFEQRDYRATSKTVSQATFSDDPASLLVYDYITQADPLDEIFNEITAEVQPYTVQTLAVLWTLGDVPFTLGPGEEITYVAQYPNSASGNDAAFVSAWTTPVIGTDITQTGVGNNDISISVEKTATNMAITIENIHGTDTATITLVQARGVPVLKNDSFQVAVSDSISQQIYGPRAYPLPSPWFPSAAVAQTGCQFVIDKYKNPRPILTISFPATTSELKEQALNRDVSDRITVVSVNDVKLGINADFYIESIQHRVTPGLHQTTWELSPV